MLSGSKRVRGATLVEILLAGSLLLVLAGLATTFFLRVMRGTGESYEKAALQSEALIILRRLDNDLSLASSAKMVLAQPLGTNVAVAFQQIHDVDNNGFVSWEPELTLYHWKAAETSLERKTWPPDTASLNIEFLPFNPPTLSTTQVEQMATTDNGTERRLSRRVSGFSIAPTTEGVWDLEFTVVEPRIANSDQTYRRRYYLSQ